MDREKSLRLWLGLTAKPHLLGIPQFAAVRLGSLLPPGKTSLWKVDQAPAGSNASPSPFGDLLLTSNK